MAKDKKDKTGHDAAATALTAPDVPADTTVETAPDAAASSVAPPTGSPERLTAATPQIPRQTPPQTPKPAPSRPAAHPQRGLADTAVVTVSETARVVQTVLPSRLPAYLGGAALLVLGVVDFPAVAGGALAYEAIRRWAPASRR